MSAPTQHPARTALRDLIVVSRPVSWINTAYPFAVGSLLAGGALDLRWVIGTLFFLIPYNLLMYGINDVFDYESDLRNPRKGGVEGALLDRQRHRLILIACFTFSAPFLLFLIVTGTLASTAVLALSVAAVIAYSAPRLRFKERPFIDSLTSSTHFSSPLWFALALAGFPLDVTTLLILMSFFIWGVASHAFGAVQDVVADRAAGIGSVATAIGARATVWLAVLLYAAAGVLIAAVGHPVSWLGLAAVPYIASTARFARINDDTAQKAHRGWRTFLWLNYGVGFAVSLMIISLHVDWWS